MSESNTQRPTIALFGSTGNTGKVVLRTLLGRNDYRLNIYARSAHKLYSLFPELRDNDQIKLCIGKIQHADLVLDCLSGAKIVICTLGSDGMSPETILEDSALALVNALKVLKIQAGAEWEKPRLLYLSSASENEQFSAPRPRFVHWMITTAFQLGYTDLQRAQRVLLEDPSLCSLLLVQPNVLVDETGTGSFISIEHAKIGCSYEDLGHGFVDLATKDSYRTLATVAVSSDGASAFEICPYHCLKTVPRLLRQLFPLGCTDTSIFGTDVVKPDQSDSLALQASTMLHTSEMCNVATEILRSVWSGHHDLARAQKPGTGVKCQPEFEDREWAASSNADD